MPQRILILHSTVAKITALNAVSRPVIISGQPGIIKSRNARLSAFSPFSKLIVVWTTSPRRVVYFAFLMSANESHKKLSASLSYKTCRADCLFRPIAARDASSTGLKGRGHNYKVIRYFNMQRAWLFARLRSWLGRQRRMVTDGSYLVKLLTFLR